MGGWFPFFEGAPFYPPISSGSFYPSHYMHYCLWYQSRFPNQNRSRPYRKSDLNRLPIVARVRQHRALLVARIARDYFHFIFFTCACCHFLIRSCVPAGPCPSQRTSTYLRDRRSLWVRACCIRPTVSHARSHVHTRRHARV
jgi:hypothetical protein